MTWGFDTCSLQNMITTKTIRKKLINDFSRYGMTVRYFLHAITGKTVSLEKIKTLLPTSLLDQIYNGLRHMTEPENLVDSEIADHQAVLDGWIGEVATMTVPKGRKGVNDRFVQDCQQLKNYLSQAESPSTADLCDFEDRRNSLEIQYNNIIGEIG